MESNDTYIEPLKSITSGTDLASGALFLIDKPLNWTSFDVVNKIRYAVKRSRHQVKKVGHAGTLDPLATGLLLICVGKYTKRINELQNMGKRYTGEMLLGRTTPSYDLETEFDSEEPVRDFKSEELDKVRESFLGDILQKPPVFSALKKNGKALYKYAREGTPVKIAERSVSIQSFDLSKIELPKLEFDVRVSKGTYIRSLVHDFGQQLSCGAVLTSLARTETGPYCLEDAWQLDELIEHIDADLQ